MDLKLPGMLNAAIKDCPVFGGKVKSFDAAAVAKRPGVKKVVQVGDSAVAVVADTWWHAKTALDALPIEWDDGPNAKASSADIAAMLKAGLDAPTKRCRQPGRRREGRARRRGAQDRGGVFVPAPEPRDDGGDERDGALDTAERCEVWCPTQNGEAALAATVRGGGPAARASATSTRSTSAAASAGAARHDWVRQAVAIAKEMPGTPVKLIWSREEDMLHGRYHPITQCKLVAGLDADRATSPRCTCASRASRSSPACAPQNMQQRPGPGRVPGPEPAGAGGLDRLQLPQPAGRPCDAQPAGAAGLLARREPEPEHDLPRVLHRRGRRTRPSRIRWRCAAS